ncbi:MAG: Ryanodine receptor Ryr [Clostridiales bacterium]|nr:Ryanodine receptor Ryr [Clostridiales bacterium]
MRKTEDIELGKRDAFIPEELLDHIEQIAESVHSAWSIGRMAEGWIYGETRDQEKKTDSRLVPYEELPESEKDYDRNTAMAVLRAVVELGYVIKMEVTIWECL